MVRSGRVHPLWVSSVFVLVLSCNAPIGTARAGWISPTSTGTYEVQDTFDFSTGEDTTETNFYAGFPPQVMSYSTFQEGPDGSMQMVSFQRIAAGTFDLNQLAADAPVILSLDLSFSFAASSLSSEMDVTLFGTDHDITESDFTSSHSPSSGRSLTLPTVGFDGLGNKTVSVDITDFVMTLTGKYQYLGIQFSLTNNGQVAQTVFDPYLGPSVYVPEPTSVSLGALAVMFLGAVNLRMRRRGIPR